MRLEDLSYIVCPTCKESLDIDIKEQNDLKIKTAMLLCSTCKKTYNVKNYIPRFISSQEYVESFGDEWHLFKRVKNDRLKMSEDEMKNYLALTKDDIYNKKILEIGCGAGPYLEVSARRFKAAHIVGIDLSQAVDAAYENVGHLDNVTIIQANLFSLPFKDNFFDVVYSLGVLHHTPNTHEAFKAVSTKVTQGGVLSIWLYGAYWLRKSRNQDRLRRYITSKLSSKTLYKVSKIASYLYYLYKIPFIGTALRETIPIAMDKDKEVRALNTFDLYSPTYIHRHYVDEVYTWFKNEGFENIEPAHYLLGMKASRKVSN